jgi:hypothetical protein
MMTAVCAMAVSLALPAIAQNSMSSPMSSSGSSSGMTCDQMMAKEQKMSGASTGARMTIAQNHMHLANMAKQKNDEAGCKAHVQQAMDAMK